jgi:hypothetical protein
MRIPFVMERIRTRPRPFERRSQTRAGRMPGVAQVFPVRMIWRGPRPMSRTEPDVPNVTHIQNIVHVHPRADVVRETMQFVWIQAAGRASRSEPMRVAAPAAIKAPASVLERARRQVHHPFGTFVRTHATSSFSLRKEVLSTPRQPSFPVENTLTTVNQRKAQPAKGGPAAVSGRAAEAVWRASMDNTLNRPVAARSAAVPAGSFLPTRNGSGYTTQNSTMPAINAQPRTPQPAAARSAPSTALATPRYSVSAPAAVAMDFAAPRINPASKPVKTYREPVPAPLAFRTTTRTPTAENPAVRDVGTAARHGAAASTQSTALAGPVRHANAVPPALDRAMIDRLADDVIQRIERRSRIERERRGL